MDAVNVAGAKILDVVMTVGYWAVLVVGGIAVINSIAKKDPQAAIKSALGYTTAFAAFYMLKWGIDMIRTVFA